MSEDGENENNTNTHTPYNTQPTAYISMVKKKKVKQFGALFRHYFCTMKKETLHHTQHRPHIARRERERGWNKKKMKKKKKVQMIMVDVSALIQFRKLNIAYIITCNVLSISTSIWIEDGGLVTCIFPKLHRHSLWTKNKKGSLLNKILNNFNNCPLNILGHWGNEFCDEMKREIKWIGWFFSGVETMNENHFWNISSFFWLFFRSYTGYWDWLLVESTM